MKPKSTGNFKVAENPHHLHLDFYAPRSANAFSLDVARELIQIQKSYKSWSKPVIVSSAHPGVFCSGGNLSEYQKLKSKAEGLKINREIQKALDQFAKWPVVKLAVIEGDVLGGGMEWLARFDFRWCTPNVFFSFWQRRIGLSPGWGGGRAWSETQKNIRGMLLESELIGAAHAQTEKLVDRIVCSWKIRDTAAEWSDQMDASSVRSLLKWSTATEAKVFQSLWLGPEHRSILMKWKSK